MEDLVTHSNESGKIHRSFHLVPFIARGLQKISHHLPNEIYQRFNCLQGSRTGWCQDWHLISDQTSHVLVLVLDFLLGIPHIMMLVLTLGLKWTALHHQEIFFFIG